MIETAAGRYMYSRETVRQVRLDSAHSAGDREVADKYWNREKGWLITAVRQAPVIGGWLAGPLESASPGAATALSALVLLAILSYAAYRGYGTLVVARGVQELNRRKLQMEVKKLRYELESMRKALGLEQVEEEETEPGLRIPDVDVMAFLRQKLGGALTEQAKLERVARWRRVWEAHKGRATWLQQGLYYAHELLNIAGAVFFLLLGLGFAVDVVLPLVDPTFGGGIAMSVVFAGLSLLCLRAFMHFRRRGEAITTTHREFRAGAGRS